MNKNLLNAVLWLAAGLFAVGRCILPPNHPHLTNGFAAAAHLFVGGLIGGFFPTRNWQLLAMAILLSIVEVAVFFMK